jgi:hypothetical protein
MKMYGELEVQIHTFLTSGVAGCEWSASCPGCLIPKREPSIYWPGGWVSPRASLDIVEERKISFPCQELNPSSFAVQSVPWSLYRDIAVNFIVQ